MSGSNDIVAGQAGVANDAGGPTPPKTPRIGDLLGRALKHVSFIPLHGEMIQFDSYVSNGLKPPTSLGLENLSNSIREQLWKSWMM